jgi:hypothetical protein
MVTETSDQIGGMQSLAEEMIPTLESLARHREAMPDVLDAAERTERGCVNQPVHTWRNLAALVSGARQL